MASLNISLPDPLRDYVQDRIDSGQYGSASDYIRDLIRRDQGRIGDEERWLRELDISLVETMAERNAGGGVDLDVACEGVSAMLGRGAGISKP